MPQGESGMDMVLNIFLVILLGSIVLPIAFDEWFNASTGNWNSYVATLWPIIPVIALVAVLYILYNKYV